MFKLKPRQIRIEGKDVELTRLKGNVLNYVSSIADISPADKPVKILFNYYNVLDKIFKEYASPHEGLSVHTKMFILVLLRKIENEAFQDTALIPLEAGGGIDEAIKQYSDIDIDEGTRVADDTVDILLNKPTVEHETKVLKVLSTRKLEELDLVRFDVIPHIGRVVYEGNDYTSIGDIIKVVDSLPFSDLTKLHKVVGNYRDKVKFHLGVDVYSDVDFFGTI